MAEFDDKLNSLLSNPEAMDQIMKMAQSLMGGAPAAEPSGGPSAPTGGSGGTSPTSGVQPPGTGAQTSPPPTGEGGADLSFLTALGNWDPQTIAALLPILRELGSPPNSNARQLLFALRPYLKPERQDKVERALQLARLFRVGKRFLLKGDRYV